MLLFLGYIALPLEILVLPIPWVWHSPVSKLYIHTQSLTLYATIYDTSNGGEKWTSSLACGVVVCGASQSNSLSLWILLVQPLRLFHLFIILLEFEFSRLYLVWDCSGWQSTSREWAVMIALWLGGPKRKGIPDHRSSFVEASLWCCKGGSIWGHVDEGSGGSWSIT